MSKGEIQALMPISEIQHEADEKRLSFLTCFMFIKQRLPPLALTRNLPGKVGDIGSEEIPYWCGYKTSYQFQFDPLLDTLILRNTFSPEPIGFVHPSMTQTANKSPIYH